MKEETAMCPTQRILPTLNALLLVVHFTHRESKNFWAGMDMKELNVNVVNMTHKKIAQDMHLFKMLSLICGINAHLL